MSEIDARGGGPRPRRPLLATLTFAGLRHEEALAPLARRRPRVRAPAGRELEDRRRGARCGPAAPLRDELAAYKAGCRRAGAGDLVFATASGRPLSQSNVRNRFLAGAVRAADRHRADAGLGALPDGLTPHSLRRTFISLLLAVGEEVPYVMAQVGHTDPKVTLGIYAQAMFRRDGERERLRDLVQGAPDTAANTRPSKSPLTSARNASPGMQNGAE